MSAFEELNKKLVELADIRSALALMSWDQEVYMPAGAAQRRAGQISTIGGIHHEKLLSELGPLLEKVEKEGGKDKFELANIRKIKKEFEKAQKLPTKFVRELYKVSSEAQSKWQVAKGESDFSKFSEVLARLLDIKRKEAEYYGYEVEPYDALLDSYEPEGRASVLRPLFEQFKEELASVVPQILEAPQVDDSFLKQEIDTQAQLAFGEKLIQDLGYDLHHGRQDLSMHPFSIPLGMEDVRITTVVKPNDIMDMLYSTIHEAGHAMYEQGFKPEHYGMPAGEPSSISIHESQSRLYENNLARSLPFWEYYFEDFAALFPDKLKGKGPEDVFKAVNKIAPNLIRINSDELTYHYHIILRFEIETALIAGKVKVAELPELWNAKIKEYLGLDVPNEAAGVLQDIHWSHGSFGYFPTYSLGSFYGAQFMAKADESIEGLNEKIKSGDFSPLLGWMRENVHMEGKLLNSQELCKKATGRELNVGPFIAYMKEKLGRVYGIEL